MMPPTPLLVAEAAPPLTVVVPAMVRVEVAPTRKAYGLLPVLIEMLPATSEMVFAAMAVALAAVV